MERHDTLPKGPTGNKLFLLIKFIYNPISAFEEYRNIYGKTFTVRLLGQPDIVVISDPDELKQVFLANSNQLHAGEINATLLQPIFGSYSLLTMNGEKHIEHRKLLLPSFHGQRIKNYGELMVKTVKNKTLHWEKGSPLNLVAEVRNMTFSIILSAIFGIDEAKTQFEALTTSLHALVNLLSKPFSVITLLNPSLHRNLGPLTPWAKLMKRRREVDVYLFDEIAARKKINLDSRIDILSLLLQARDEAGNPMTDQEIRDEMLTLLIAGHDTSTTGAAWTFYWILSNPPVLNKLKDELNHVVSDENELVSNLDKLVYLDAVIKEALRITPVIPYVVRITKEAYQIGEYTLPKGTMISPCIYLAHHDPENWDEPDTFIPERFLHSLDAPFTYLPFGSGLRRCIGASFAQYEMKIVIARVLLYAELELKKNYKPKPVRQGVAISPSGLPVIVKKMRPDKLEID